MTIRIEGGTRVMFTGDSITDCQRTVGENALGWGYPLHVAAEWDLQHPDRHPVWLNSGVGGNRVSDLQERWADDVLREDPDVVSILVGVNDTGFHFSFGHDRVTGEAYHDGYRSLLEPLADRGVGLVLLEPFLLPVSDAQRAWRPDLDEKIQVVRGLAQEFGAALVATDGVLAAKAARTGNSYWAADGVHPTNAGHAAIAHAWLEAVA